MTSRRRFMGLGLGLGAATVLRGLPAEAQSVATESAPAAIAALRSVKDQAQPISVDERRQRIDRAMKLMADNRQDAIVLCGGTSTVYFTAVRWWVSERFFAIVIPAKGKPLCVCPHFEADRASEQLKLGPLSDVELVTWQEDQDPFALMARALRSRSTSIATIGVEERVQFAFSDGIETSVTSKSSSAPTTNVNGRRKAKRTIHIALFLLPDSGG